jgi:hypothetical protein
VSSISPRMASLQYTVIADRQVSPDEISRLRQQFQTDRPTASVQDFDVYLKTLFKGDSDHTSAELDALMHTAQSGAVVNLDLDLDMDFSFEVSGAELLDRDGVYQRSKDDLHGNIETLTGRVDIFGDRLNEHLRSQLHELADAALLPEDASWFDQAKRMGAGFLIEGSSLDIAEARTPEGKEAIAITIQTPLKDTQVLMHANDLGQIIIATAFDEASDDFINRQLAKQINPRLQDALGAMQAELLKLGIQTEIASEHGQYTLTPQAMTLSAEQFQQLTGRALPASYAQGEISLTPEDIDLSIQDGQLQFSIKNIAIKGSSDKQGREVTSAGQNEPQGVYEPTALILETARLNGALDAEGKLRDTVVSDVKGSVKAATHLSPQTLQTIKDHISALADGIDEQLKAYGLNREQLTAMIGQLPNDLLQQLLSSNNKSDIASAARTLGIEGQQLESALSFLKEQPYRQLVGDLSQLSNMIEENTQIHGHVDFQLASLTLADGDSDFLALLSGLTLQAQVDSTTPEGVHTSGTLAARAERVTLSETETRLDQTNLRTDLSIRAVAVGETTTPSEQLNTFRAALTAAVPNTFVKQDTYLKDEGSDRLRRGKGLNTTDLTPLLAKLDNDTLLGLLGRSPAALMAEAKTLGLNGKESFYLTYLVSYLDKYVTPNTPTAPSQARQNIQSEIDLEQATFAPKSTQINGLQGTARLDSTDSQGRSSSELTVQATVDRLQTQGEQVFISHRERAQQMTQFKQHLKALPAQALLPDEGPAKLRLGIGIRAGTADRLLNTFSVAELVAFNGLSDGEIEEEGRQQGLSQEDARLLRYTLRYIDQYVSEPAVALKVSTRVEGDGKAPDTVARAATTFSELRASEAGIAAEGLRVNADLDANATLHVEGDTQHVEATRQRLALEGGRVTDLEAKNGATEITAHAADISGVAEQGQLSGEATVDWRIANQTSTTQADLRGTTALALRLNELYQANTHNIQGEIKISTPDFLAIARSAGMGDFVDTLLKDKTLLNPSMYIQVEPDTRFDYTQQGTAQYKVKARLPGLDTKYGPASLAFETQSNGTMTVRTQLDPTRGLEYAIRDAVAAESQAESHTTIRNGHIDVGVDFSFASADTQVRLEGDKVRIQVQDARFLGLIEVKGTARSRVLEALQRYGAHLDGHDIILPVSQLTAEVLKNNPATARSLENVKIFMAPNNRITLDFSYRG